MRMKTFLFSSSTLAGIKGRLHAGCRMKYSGAMLNLWLLPCFLVMALLGHLEVVAGGEGKVWSSTRYPNEVERESTWRPSQPVLDMNDQRTVELPPVFSLLAISLSRDWPHDYNASSTVATVPLVCFGFYGPPLPVEPRKSLLEAAINAGASKEASGAGACGWFNDTVEVNVTNLEVRSGLLHVGIFSDPKPTRTQSKMIPRGKEYTFGMGIQVFWCGTEALGGPDCNLGIDSLPPMLLKSLHSINTPLHDDRYFLSSRSSRNHLEKELVAQSSFDQLDLSPQPEGYKVKAAVDQKNQMQEEFGTTSANSGWSDWISSSQNCIGLDENQFFSLQVVDVLQELEIKYECISNVSESISKCEEFESWVKETRIPLLHLRHSALPGRDNSDFLGEPSAGSIIITEPKRGWWFLAIFNPMVTSNQKGARKKLTAGVDICLDLKWRARTCAPGLTGDECQWPVLLLERIMKEENESPIDSYYHPDSKSVSLDHDREWFSLESFSNKSKSNVTGDQWAFLMLNVAHGAAGAFLSISVKTSPTVQTDLYARHEGCPSSSVWDFKATKEDSQPLSDVRGKSQGPRQDMDGAQTLTASKYHILYLPVIYPTEGYWCIGLKYMPPVTSTQAYVLGNSQDPQRTGVGRSTGNWLQKLNLSFASHDDLDIRHGNLSSSIGENVELLLELHGCPNKCSGHGSCQTVYEASRLHVISYCRCDVTHGGFDCSVAMLPLWKDIRQRFLLIFSNAAAILPSIWALRRKAYSEWITFMLSGIASAIYHSCDSGGWCAMSFSTLQFLDFWLSFVAIVMTCLLMAGFDGPTKAMLHIGCAVLTAAVAKEDATSGWSILVVVLISSFGLVLGWGLETQKLSALRLRWSVSTNGIRSAWLQWGLRLVRSFYMQLIDRFHWPYLFLGLAFLLSALVSNLMELPQTYWIFHSWWHVGIYTSAFILLYSIRTVNGALPRRVDDLEGYQRVSTTQRQDEDGLITDSHQALVSELNSFPENHIH